MKTKLDFMKPIIAESLSCHTKYLLLPQLKTKGGYTIEGYNWLNLNTMDWNSCCYFSTIEKAVKSYSKPSYTIYNATIAIGKVK